MSPALWIPYIRFLLHAKGRHGLHSPFAYGFVENVLRGGYSYEHPSDDSAPTDTASVNLGSARMPYAGSVSADMSSVNVGSVSPSASASPVFRPRDFQYLIRLIAYWKPGEIRLFPEVLGSRSALEHLFPSLRIRKAEAEIVPATPVLWIGKVGVAEGHKLPVFEDFIFKGLPVFKEQAMVLLDASSSLSNRQLAEDLLTKSTLPMGIDFWNGIFLASDSRFRVQQRFCLKPFC